MASYFLYLVTAPKVRENDSVKVLLVSKVANIYSTFDSEVFIYTRVLFCQNGAKIVESSVRGKVASTKEGGSNGWIDLGNFTGKIMQPNQ